MVLLPPAPGSGPPASVAAQLSAEAATRGLAPPEPLARSGEEGVQALAALAPLGAAPQALEALGRPDEESLRAWAAPALGAAPQASAALGRPGAVAARPSAAPALFEEPQAWAARGRPGAGGNSGFGCSGTG
jgi:hypothetical protein